MAGQARLPIARFRTCRGDLRELRSPKHAAEARTA